MLLSENEGCEVVAVEVVAVMICNLLNFEIKKKEKK